MGTDSLRTPLTGVGRYTQELCLELLKSPNINGLEGFDFGKLHSIDERLKKLVLESMDPQPRGGRLQLRASLSQSRIAARLYRFYATSVCGFLLGKKSDSLFHSPNFHLPAFSGKSIVTIHDLSYLLLPDFHPKARIDWMKRLVPAALARSSHIICVSESTKRDLIRCYDVDPEKISVTYLGVNDDFRPRDRETISPTLEAYGLSPDRYLLCVSTIEPRKNIETLINAYLQLSLSLRREYPLVLVGGFGWNYESLKSEISCLPQEGVKHLGFVPQRDLPVLYNGARCLVYPSFYEGFGLPVLEAQASGTAVITSDIASIPEVASEEALLIFPEDGQALKGALVRAIEDTDWREDCSRAGIIKASSFTWSECARATEAIYKQVMESR